MKLPIFFVVSETYEVVTPESAEHGDAQERGFNFQDKKYTPDELYHYLRREGYHEPSSTRLSSVDDWITTSTIEDDAYFRKGHHRRHSLHLSRIVDADGKELPIQLQNSLWIKALEMKDPEPETEAMVLH